MNHIPDKNYEQLGLAIVVQACEDALSSSSTPYDQYMALQFLKSDRAGMFAGEFAKRCYETITTAIENGTLNEVRKRFAREKLIIAAELGGQLHQTGK